MNNDSGNQLVNLIREITKIEISKEDTTCICQVDSINSDGTANIIILPDMETKINNIQNNSNNEIASGDFVVLYKIKNQINNSFIMAKCGKSVQKSRDKVVMVNYNQSEPSQIVQNAVLYTPQSLTDTQKLQARTNIGILDPDLNDNQKIKVGNTTFGASAEIDISGTDAISVAGNNTANTITISIKDASTSAKGAVQLTNTVASGSTVQNLAVTPNGVSEAIKAALDNYYIPTKLSQLINDTGYLTVDTLPTNLVTTDKAQTITGLKTFDAPANISGTEQSTAIFKTSNGGQLIVGKEGANSGTMLRFDQVVGTVRLRFRASATAGAMVWEQPEQGAQLYIDLGKSGADYRRITFPSAAGTLALTAQIPTDYLTGGSQTTTSTEDGGSNIFTFTKANGQTATFTVKNGSKGTDATITSINGLNGGTLTSPLVITGGDQATAAKIALNQGNKGQITDSSTSTILGFMSSDTLTVGSTNYATNIRGKNTRPTYNGNNLALLSDVPTVNNGKLTIKQGGVEKGSFTANQSGNVEIDLESGGGVYYITYTAIHMSYSGGVDVINGFPIEDFFCKLWISPLCTSDLFATGSDFVSWLGSKTFINETSGLACNGYSPQLGVACACWDDGSNVLYVEFSNGQVAMLYADYITISSNLFWAYL